MKRIRVEVCPDKGNWTVTADKRVVFRFVRKADAVKAAVAWCRSEAGLGRRLSLRIKGRDGTIIEERTYPRSSDPRRFKG